MKLSRLASPALGNTMKDEKPYSRKEFITDCVKAYIKNNPVEYQRFLSLIAERRKKLFDPTFGQLRNGTKVNEDHFRMAFSLPPRLMNALDMVKHHSDEKIFEAKGEMAWFGKTFPEFRIPNKI